MKALIVEDSATLCAIYKTYLEGSGLDIHTVNSYQETQGALETLHPDIILLDIELPDGNGLDLLPVATGMDPAPAVVVMTGHGLDYADRAITLGADDFLAKPFDAARLRVTLKNAAEKHQLSQKLMDKAPKRSRLGPLRGGSKVMQAVYDTIDSLSTTLATAFITGESGTGKELAAMAIHNLSDRAVGEFVTVNCAAIPDDLVESELFGEVAGVRAGSYAREGLVRHAHGGTLFLDEVCDMPYELQSVLLRFIQNGRFKPVGSDAELEADVRIIAATNRDPLFEMREGRLREDLFYRLHVIPLRMPPLRERDADVIELAEFFLRLYAGRESKEVAGFSRDALSRIATYPWPGNVRQLQNIVHRLVIMSDQSTIGDEAVRVAIADSDLTDGIVEPSQQLDLTAVSVAGERSVEPLWLTEKNAIQAAIEACDGNINRAAGLLEVAPSTIYRKIQSWRTTGESSDTVEG